MEFRTKVNLSLAREREKARNELIELLEEVDKLGVNITNIEAQLTGLKGKQKEEKITIDELKNRIQAIAQELTDVHSTLNNALKIMAFMIKQSERVKNGTLKRKTFTELAGAIYEKYPTALQIKDLIGDVCKRLHRTIRAKIIGEQAITGDIEKTIAAIRTINEKLGEI